MTVREYFRRLRAEQWAVDSTFFDRFAACVPRRVPLPEHDLLVLERYRTVRNNPFYVTYPETVEAPADRLAFLDLHRAVCFGEVLIAPIVAPPDAVFASRRDSPVVEAVRATMAVRLRGTQQYHVETLEPSRPFDG